MNTSIVNIPTMSTWHYNINEKVIYYKLNGKFHRINGPAIIHYKNDNIEQEEYWINNNCHRENGPAVIRYDENGNITKEIYYLNGIEITDEFKIMVIRGLGMNI